MPVYFIAKGMIVNNFRVIINIQNFKNVDSIIVYKTDLFKLFFFLLEVSSWRKSILDFLQREKGMKSNSGSADNRRKAKKR